MITTITIPPEILQYYDTLLLRRPVSYFKDGSKDLLRVYQWIVKHLKKKCMKDEFRRNKFEQLEKRFLELYEQAKIKEERNKENKEIAANQFFYRFGKPDKYGRRIFDRFRSKSYK